MASTAVLFGNIDTWAIWNLTGAHVTDVTNALCTLLMNLRTLDWDDDILNFLRDRHGVRL